MDLLLTDGGLTEKVYDRVRRELGIPSARTTRRCIEEASESLDARQVLTANLPVEDQPAEDEVVVLCGSVDNANVIGSGSSGAVRQMLQRITDPLDALSLKWHEFSDEAFVFSLS